MRRVTMSDRALLIGNEAADLLLDYAALVAQLNRGDSVRLNAIDTHGEDVAVGVLLNSGSTMLVESTVCARPDPDNALAVAYLMSRLAQYEPGLPLGAIGEGRPRLGLV